MRGIKLWRREILHQTVYNVSFCDILYDVAKFTLSLSWKKPGVIPESPTELTALARWKGQEHG